MIQLSHPTAVLKGVVHLPASKSISNRLLVLRQLYAPGWDIRNISEARDSRVLEQLLNNPGNSYNVLDAGTSMRFLCAYLCTREGTHLLKGTDRMHQRPIGELVQQLRNCGARIDYLGSEGFPPLRIQGGPLAADRIDLASVASSQFISAMLMILPMVQGHPQLIVSQEQRSWDFVALTMDCMRHIGFQFEVQGNTINVTGSPKFPEPVQVEADWTSFYYWYSMAVLSKEADLFFPELNTKGMQTERRWLDVLNHPLIKWEQTGSGLRLLRHAGPIHFDLEGLDLSDHPDLAPTFATLFAALGQATHFRGLELLGIKESDRDAGIRDHVAAIGWDWKRQGERWHLTPTAPRAPTQVFRSNDDHRMFLCAASLAVRHPVLLDDPEVCVKSYPAFMDQMHSLGFEVSKAL